MNNQNQSQKWQRSSKIESWQLAYAARELRHKKTVTLSCLKSEKAMVLEQLGCFSHKGPFTSHIVEKPNSREIYLEIFN